MSTLLILDQVRNCDPWSYPNPGFVSLIWNIVGKIFPFFFCLLSFIKGFTIKMSSYMKYIWSSSHMAPQERNGCLLGLLAHLKQFNAHF